jgi:hypothetical protein
MGTVSDQSAPSGSVVHARRQSPSLLCRLAIALACISLLTAVAPLHAQPKGSAQMYRYMNDEGNKVIAYQVPPEFVSRGYEVLSPTGALIRVVPRQPGEGERADIDAQTRLDREAAAEQERLQKWDESLLLRYSSIEDIEAARDRALTELRVRVSILRGKLRSLKQQVENYQALAADEERQGRDVSPQHLAAISDLRADIGVTERAINDREREIASVNESYDRDVERFSSLLDIVEMRKNMTSEGGSGG